MHKIAFFVDLAVFYRTMNDRRSVPQRAVAATVRYGALEKYGALKNSNKFALPTVYTSYRIMLHKVTSWGQNRPNERFSVNQNLVK